MRLFFVHVPSVFSVTSLAYSASSLKYVVPTASIAASISSLASVKLSLISSMRFLTSFGDSVAAMRAVKEEAYPRVWILWNALTQCRSSCAGLVCAETPACAWGTPPPPATLDAAYGVMLMTLMPLEGAAAPPRADGAWETRSDTTLAAFLMTSDVLMVLVNPSRCH